MRKMTKVTRFKCEWCGKEFHTQDRHDCKFDPDKRNCLSCKHVRGSFDVRDSEGNYVFFKCAKMDGEECDLTNDISVLHADHWKGDCPNYDVADEYKGKATFVENCMLGLPKPDPELDPLFGE